MPVASFAINLELVILTQAYLALMIVYSDLANSGFISEVGISPCGMSLAGVAVGVVGADGFVSGIGGGAMGATGSCVAIGSGVSDFSRNILARLPMPNMMKNPMKQMPKMRTLLGNLSPLLLGFLGSLIGINLGA